ncbi:MAG: substrate-binding domain-containing protein, partial [Dehalococcoidia bacterium]
QQRPNAILLDAASTTALNPVVQRACAAGIKVITFDETATAPCADQVSVDVNLIGKAWANWFVKSLHGRGSVFEDQGLPGHGLSTLFDGALQAQLKTYPNVKVVCNYLSQYAIGPEKQGVSQCLAAHAQVDGIWDLGYATGGMTDLVTSGHPQVPIVGGAYNNNTLTCYRLKGPCLFAAYPAYISVFALRTAVKVLDGGSVPKNQIIPFPFIQQGGANTTVPGEIVQKLQLHKNALPGLPPIPVPWQIPGLPGVTLQQIQAASLG